jgi:phosphate:Na+ symporter
MSQESFSILSVVTLLGGTALLLYGLDVMDLNLRNAAGPAFKRAIEMATKNTWLGVLLGTAITFVVQSSTAVTSILVSFVQSGLITFERTIGVMLGANIGTSSTGLMMALNILDWALGIVFIGFMIQALAKRNQTIYIGYAVMASGIMLFGLDLMSQSMTPLRHSQIFLDMMQNFESPIIGILVGAAFTALIHSSAGALGVMIGLGMQGLLTVEAAIPLMLGANIGTCVTAVIVSLKTSYQAKRVAAAHIIFNILGVLPFAFIVPQFTHFISSFTQPGNVAQFIAYSQLAFNVITVAIAIPFIKQLAWLSAICVPADEIASHKKYTMPNVSNFSQNPDIALAQSRDSIRCMRTIVREMLCVAGKYFLNQRNLEFSRIEDLKRDHHDLRRDLVRFLSKINARGNFKLGIAETSDILNQSAVINEIEHIVHRLSYALEEMDRQVPSFDKRFSGLDQYFFRTVRCFNYAVDAFLRNSRESAIKISREIEALAKFAEQFRTMAIEQIHSDNNLHDRINLEVLDVLRSINGSSQRICNVVLTESSRALVR